MSGTVRHIAHPDGASVFLQSLPLSDASTQPARAVIELPRLRIAHVTATFPPYPAGTGNVCFHNARHLAARGHEVHVFTATLPGAARPEERDGLTVHRFEPLVRIGNAALLPRLAGALRDFDIVHLHYPFFGGEFAALAARLNRTPLVITYHQDVVLPGPLGLVERALRQTVGRATLRSADCLLFTSLDYARASHARPLLRGREQVIDELPNGVDASAFTPGDPPAALQERHGLADDDRIVLLVARLDRAHYFKGVGVLLAALTHLPPVVHGVIIGDGDQRAAYAAMARTLGVADRVVFAGRVSDQELPQYYRLADVTVLPSVTAGEAFGLVLLESMACGTPVIASNLPGVRTVVAAGRDGLLVAPGEPEALAAALRTMLGDAARRYRMGQQGRAKVEQRYDWQRVGTQLESVYCRVLSDAAAPAERRV